MDRPVSAPRRIPHWAWELLAWHNGGEKGSRPTDAPKRVPMWFWAWYRWRNWLTTHKKPTPPVQEHVIMYDSIDLSQIPSNAHAVAGYIGGRWPTYSQLPAKFPNALHLSIAVASRFDADCLDIERGDSIPSLAPAWVRRQQKRGLKRPVLYSSVSEMPQVLAALKSSGISRSEVRLWTAHYIGRAHQCSPSTCGSDRWGFHDSADATQYWDHALGRSLDVSLCSPNFFSANL